MLHSGCMSFVGSLLQSMWAGCKERAQGKTWQAWIDQLQSAVSGGTLDPNFAMQETCRLQAEQQSCEQLGRYLVNCNIIGMIQIGVEAGQTKQRCDTVSGFAFAPQNIGSSINGLISGEIVGGLLQNLLARG